MAVRRQPLAVIHDDNSENQRAAGNARVAKSDALKVQQPDLSNCKTLSNIANKVKPLANLGTDTPIAPRTEGVRVGSENDGNWKGFTVMADPELLGKSGVKGQTVTRAPLRNITNVESSLQKAKTVKETKPENKSLTSGPNPTYEITEEMKQQIELWAHEGIETMHLTRKDMDALEEKMAEEEINNLVAQALNYRSEIPCWLPGALAKHATEIKDHLELDLAGGHYRLFFFPWYISLFLVLLNSTEEPWTMKLDIEHKSFDEWCEKFMLYGPNLFVIDNVECSCNIQP